MHTPTPWRDTSDGSAALLGADGEQVGVINFDHDATRIVACVNACEGIDDPAVALSALREAARAAHWLLAEMLDADDGPFSHPEPPDVDGARKALNTALDSARRWYTL